MVPQENHGLSTQITMGKILNFFKPIPVYILKIISDIWWVFFCVCENEKNIESPSIMPGTQQVVNKWQICCNLNFSLSILKFKLLCIVFPYIRAYYKQGKHTHVNNLEHLSVIYIVFSHFTHTACPDQSCLNQSTSRDHSCLISASILGMWLLN